MRAKVDAGLLVHRQKNHGPLLLPGLERALVSGIKVKLAWSFKGFQGIQNRLGHHHKYGLTGLRCAQEQTVAVQMGLL